MAPSVELSKRLFAFTSLCGALSTDRATPFHGKSMENVSGRREWRGAGRGEGERMAKDTSPMVHATATVVGGDGDVTCGIRCHCRLAGYTKKTVFCFSSARS